MKFSSSYMNIVWLHDDDGLLQEILKLLREVFEFLDELDAAT